MDNKTIMDQVKKIMSENPKRFSAMREEIEMEEWMEEF